MSKRILVAMLATAVGLMTSMAQAQISWVGSTSNDIFDEANWDLTGSSVTMLDPNVSIESDVVIGPGPFDFAPVIPELPGQQRFQLADGMTLTLDGTALTIDGNDGVGGAPGTADGPTVDVVGGAEFNPFFVVNDVQVNIDGSSSATFGGGGNPINLSIVDLTPGAVFSFLAETPDAYRAEHLSKTTVLGAPAVEGDNILIEPLGAAGSTITVVPEPSTALLSLVGLLAMLKFRRK